MIYTASKLRRPATRKVLWKGVALLAIAVAALTGVVLVVGSDQLNDHTRNLSAPSPAEAPANS